MLFLLLFLALFSCASDSTTIGRACTVSAIRAAEAKEPATRSATITPAEPFDLRSSRISRRYATEIKNGTLSFVDGCKNFRSVFDEASRYSGIDAARLAGIAIIESAGCTTPLIGKVGFMHVRTPDKGRHLAPAAEALGVSIDELGKRYKIDVFAEATLAAFMLRDYLWIGGSESIGIRMYRLGPNSQHLGGKTADRYELSVVAAAIMIDREWRGLDPQNTIVTKADIPPLYR